MNLSYSEELSFCLYTPVQWQKLLMALASRNCSITSNWWLMRTGLSHVLKFEYQAR